MQFNTKQFILPNNPFSNVNVSINDSIQMARYNNILRSGITIETPVIINNNYYTTAYVDTNAFNSFEENLFNLLNSSSLLTDKILYFRYEPNNGSFVNYINNLYNNYNVRLFLSSANSSDCNSIFSFLNNHNDVIFISCTSTANLPNKPSNLLRLSLEDESTINNVILNIFPNFYKLKNLNNNTSNNNSVINKIYVIYTNDTYGNSSKNIIFNLSSTISNLIFEYYEFNKDTNTNTIIYNLLNSNNNDNEVFFIYTLQPQNFLNFLDTQLMHNKFYLFGDTFIDINLYSNLKLNNSHIIIAASDSFGHTITRKLLNTGSGASSSNQQIDLLLKFIFCCYPIIYNNLGNNLNNIINKFDELDIFYNGQWYEKDIGLYFIKQNNPNINNKFNLIYDYYINFNEFNSSSLRSVIRPIKY